MTRGVGRGSGHPTPMPTDPTGVPFAVVRWQVPGYNLLEGILARIRVLPATP
jgi:hypothetical protein